MVAGHLPDREFLWFVNPEVRKSVPEVREQLPGGCPARSADQGTSGTPTALRPSAELIGSTRVCCWGVQVWHVHVISRRRRQQPADAEE